MNSRHPQRRMSYEPDRQSSEEPSTSGRPSEQGTLEFKSRGRVAGRRHSRSSGSWEWDRTSLVTAPSQPRGSHLPKLRTAANRNADFIKAAPLDLRQGGEEGESPLTRLKRRAGHELSQGLTPLLNAPNSASGGDGSSAPLGAVWCWPFGAGPDLSLVPPPPDPVVFPPVTLADFQPFLRECAGVQARFEAVSRTQSNQAATRTGLSAPADVEAVAKAAPGEGLVEAMRAVPSMFFEEDFSLARPGTWRDVVSTEGEAQRLARLEEYGGYLDVVESQLLQEIAARSEHFFEAAGVVQDLRASLHRTYSQVTAVRRGIGLLLADAGLAAQNAERFKQRKANLETVLEKLKVVEEVASAQEAVGLLLPQGDYAAALDVLDSLRVTLATYRTAGLHAFRHLPAQLADIAGAVDELLSSEFLRASQFLDQAAVVQSISAGLAGAGLDVEAPVEELVFAMAAASEEQRGALSEELTPLVLGLKRTGHLSVTVKVLRVAAAEEVKLGIRDVVEQVLEQFVEDKSGWNTTEKLHALQPPQFLAVLRCVARTALASVAHVWRVASVVEGLLKTERGGRGLAATAATDFAEVAQAVSEAAHSRWIKLLAARSSVVMNLELSALQELLVVTQGFADAMQAAGCKPILALRNACQVQGKAYLESMHHMSLARLTSMLEQELWTKASPPASCQAVVDSIFRRARRVTETGEGAEELQDREEADEQRKLRVGAHEYNAVESELLLLDLISQYLAFGDIMPALAAEVAHRVVELVKVFNSRTCQLVLGAGAMQMAGLKSITAKHLALSCQCLGALIELHPALAAALASHLPEQRRSLLDTELGLVLQDLSLHRGEIHSKLVGIMRERLIAALRQLPALASRWGALPLEACATPSSFSLNLGKQLRTLAQVLEPMLLEEELQAVFGRVGALYSKNLAEAFSRLEPLGPAWEKQAETDLQFLWEALNELPIAVATKEATSQRLKVLCQRFAPVGDSTDVSALQKQGATKNGGSSPTPNTRQSLVSRLGTKKLPFFNREKGARAEIVPEPQPGSVALLSVAHPELRAPVLSEQGNDEPSLEEAVATDASRRPDGGKSPDHKQESEDKGGVGRQMKGGRVADRPTRETAESLDFETLAQSSARGDAAFSRLETWPDDLEESAEDPSMAERDRSETAEPASNARNDADPMADESVVRGEEATNRVAAEELAGTPASTPVGVLPEHALENAEAARLVISEAAESVLDDQAAALDPNYEAAATYMVPAIHAARDRAAEAVMEEPLAQDGASLSSHIQTGASEGDVPSSVAETSSYEAKSLPLSSAVPEEAQRMDLESKQYTPRKPAALAIEEMLKSMEANTWKNESGM